MLSPGEFWKKVPRSLPENLHFRKWMLQKAHASKRVRAGLIECCSKDILFYINTFCFTFDPRTRLKLLPFVSWPFQDRALLEILRCIEDGRDLVIEKSRDMGASWMSLVVMEWLWHFQPGNSFLMVSRKEDLVDAPGDPDSLFWKLDFVHRHLPDWLRPETDRRKLHFGNNDNGSTIDGESTTAAAGVGGRRTAMFIDEFSRIEEGYQLLAGTADTTRCRIFNFTPFGTSNAAYKLARRGDVRKLRLHWSEHPQKAAGLYRFNEKSGAVEIEDKQYKFAPDFKFVMDGRLRSPWYDGECTRRANDREVAQMLDIDYQGSAYQFFDKSMVMDLQRTYAVPPYWEGDISFDPDTGKPLELVRCAGGPLKLWTNLDQHGKPVQAPYGGGADISAGTGATNSCISFIDCHTGEKVMEYTSPYLRGEQLAPRAVALCWLFKDADGTPCKFAWEMQGPGVHFGKKLVELGYRNIYWRQYESKIGAQASDVPGWYPTPDNKRLLLEEYRAALQTRQFVNRSAEALEECLSFIHTTKGLIEHAEQFDKDDPSGASVNHGDRVIADALAWKMCRSLGIGVGSRKQEEDRLKPNCLAWRRQQADNQRRREKSWA